MSEWKEYKLKDLGCSFLSGFAFKSPDYRNEGIPLIKIGNIQDRIVHIDRSVDFISEHIIDGKVSKYFLENKDVLIAMTGQGSVGRVGRIRMENNQRVLLNQRVGKFVCDEKDINLDYLYYVLASSKYQDALFNTGAGSGQPNLSPELILDFEIPAPDYRTQLQIGAFLSSLDDKIDLLHRQNKTLEQLAGTLFRQWFVEEAEEESEKQLLLGDLIDSVSFTHKFPSDKIVFLNTSDIYLGDVLVHEPIDAATLPGQAKKSIQKHDILFSEIRPANGRYAYINFDAENYVVSTKLMVLRSKNILSQAFIYFYL